MPGYKEPVQLYRHLLKCIKVLPKDAQGYYRHYIRQGFKSHSDETDPERIKQIIERAKEDVQYIVEKYKK
uniref:LYR motif-containing protein 9 n=1 Tax=Pinctada fucata TaxID=50426 RepID=A0A194AK89_PINFU